MTFVRVFVNARGYDLPAGATALDAVQASDIADADAVRAGTRLIADSRGLPVTPETPVYGGAIYRVITNRGGASEDAT